jgi:DNA-binding transcriptional LysR family regulator
MASRGDVSDLSVHQLETLVRLLEERSVSRVARRLGVSQPAVSHALRGLREILGDPLLVPGAGGLLLTPRAAAMLDPLRASLHGLERLLTRPERFDPATARREFRLASWDAAVVALLPWLFQRISVEAPSVGVDVRPVPERGAARALDAGEIDLAIEVRPSDGPGLKARLLGREAFVCLARAGHPAIGDSLDLDTWLSLPHALISPQGEGTSVVDRELAKIGRSREIRLRIRYFLGAPLVVAGSDLVLTAPRSLAVAMTALAPLRMFEPPIPLPGFGTHLVWHERDDLDEAHAWMRGRIVEAWAASARGAPGCDRDAAGGRPALAGPEEAR